MEKLAGYHLSTLIYESSRTLVYRGLRESDQTAVVIKFLRNEYPTFHQLVQFRNQYTIAKNLNLPGVIHPYSLERYKNSYALVMEDFGGVSLQTEMKHWEKQALGSNSERLKLFFDIAVQVAEVLSGLHRQSIIHKDIKPANLLINATTGQVKITDFSIASLLQKEQQSLINPNGLEGTLAYLSPEQTGRMNRGIDYRSDFYALGVTFYELLTGQLPFSTTDPMELVYCHIAKPPIPVNDINPNIPKVLSKIVTKLMAKNAEERYQSAAGLKHDLEICRQQLKNRGYCISFPLGQQDITDRFLIPEKLYGREQEVQTLLDAFTRIASPAQNIDNEPAKEMILVAGYSGIGKTAVINEVHKPIVRQKGYFIRGKYDQFQRNIPFVAIAQAFRDLVNQVLAENSEKIEQWKDRILEKVGENAQVIIDVIPEVEWLIGKQPPVPELEPNAAQNRFNLVFLQFLQALSQAEHPLVIFLDDLQWADIASLKLIQSLMSDTEIHHLLLMGAYRDHEVNSSHPLSLTLKEILKTNTHLNTIVLAPLSQEHLNCLVAETLCCSELVAEPLTQLIYTKTKGNPFFSTQLLKSFHEENLITFNFKDRYWECDIAKIRALSLTEDVVEFMAIQLRKLPEKTQDILKLAACIGNSFDLNTLAIVSEKSSIETAQDLWKALQEGLILPQTEIYKFFTLNFEKIALQEDLTNDTDSLIQSPTYKFLHDRVQQAAYLLIDESQKQSTHLKIGQLLLQSLPLEKREEKIFDIVNQLNKGIDLITVQAEKDELAQLNLLAGQKAKLSTAYEPAVQYLSTGLNLLTPDSWQSKYDLTLRLYIAASEAEYLNTNFIRSLELAETTLAQAMCLMDQVRVYELLMSINIAKLEMLNAVEIGLATLERLGIPLLNFKGEESLVLTLPSLEELEQLPILTNASVVAALQILKLLCTPVFQAKPEIFPQIILTMVNLCLEYGNSALSAFAYGFYGLLLVGFGKLDLGYKAGKIALKLLEKFEAKELTAKVYNLFNSNIRTWKEPARHSVAPLKEGIQIGLETGDLEWGGYCTANLCSYLFFTEENLESAVQQQETYIDLCLKLKQGIPTSFSQVWQQLGLNFQGKAVNPVVLQGYSFDETEQLPHLIEAKTGTVLFVFYVAKTILFYHFNDPKNALKHVALAQEQAGAALGFMQVVILNFYQSLSLLALAKQAEYEIRKNYLEQVEKNQEQLKFWMMHAPESHQHRYELVEAEKARIFEQYWEAGDLYDRAIQNAKDNQDLREEALANELAAKFYLERGKERIATSYFIEAYYSYARWGSSAKVEDLEAHYSKFLTPVLQREKLQLNSLETLTTITYSSSSNTSTSSNISEALDLATVMKASQTLSEEIHLDKLLSKFMQVLMENAGASKCALLLKEDKVLNVVATASSSLSTSSTNLSLKSIPLEVSLDLPISLINYIKHTLEPLVIDEATTPTFIKSDGYLLRQKPKSILCMPLMYHSELVGILYLENSLTSGSFTQERLEILKVLCAQAAISLENARLYGALQRYAQEVEESYQKLQDAQLQIIQSEKMATLGQLMAGIAHEINNPVAFIAGNVAHAETYIEDMIHLLNLYQETFPNPGSEISDEIENMDLEFLKTDLPELISSMKQGVDRIRNISTSMRIFSRSDTVNKVLFDVHEGIDSTLLILKHRFKANEQRPGIEVIKDYGTLPKINCYPGQLNQVFMNLFANAVDAIDENHHRHRKHSLNPHTYWLKISTVMVEDENYIQILITDNGIGMPIEVQQKIFDHLFTTKPVGKGTGLGLSIAREIVEKQHHGRLNCISSPGEGTEFSIIIPIL